MFYEKRESVVAFIIALIFVVIIFTFIVISSKTEALGVRNQSAIRALEKFDKKALGYKKDYEQRLSRARADLKKSISKVLEGLLKKADIEESEEIKKHLRDMLRKHAAMQEPLDRDRGSLELFLRGTSWSYDAPGSSLFFAEHGNTGKTTRHGSFHWIVIDKSRVFFAHENGNFDIWTVDMKSQTFTIQPMHVGKSSWSGGQILRKKKKRW
jgi:F0F1-type ATP synthase membrane subunit b/b'